MYTIQVPTSFISGYTVSERNHRKLPLRRRHLIAKKPPFKKSHSEGRCWTMVALTRAIIREITELNILILCMPTHLESGESICREVRLLKPVGFTYIKFQRVPIILAKSSRTQAFQKHLRRNSMQRGLFIVKVTSRLVLMKYYRNLLKMEVSY